MEQLKENIRMRLNDVFRDVFDDDSIEIFDEMTSKDIDEWDSIMHISLVLAVEKEFNIKLNAAEVGKLENVGAMVKVLIEKTEN